MSNIVVFIGLSVVSEEGWKNMTPAPGIGPDKALVHMSAIGGHRENVMDFIDWRSRQLVQAHEEMDNPKPAGTVGARASVLDKMAEFGVVDVSAQCNMEPAMVTRRSAPFEFATCEEWLEATGDGGTTADLQCAFEAGRRLALRDLEVKPVS